MELVVDGTLDFVGGQDASKIPDSVPENAVYQAINISNKRGAAQPRWGFDRQKITFDGEPVVDYAGRRFDLRYIFESGKFQAAMPYLIGSDRYILIVVSGYIFLYNYVTGVISRIAISDNTRLNPRAPRINWTLAGQYIILFDYPAYPVIVDGITARRADPANMEIPVSNLGTYNQSRIFVANAGDEFTGGDAVGNLAAPLAPITFKEVFTSNSPYFQQVFRLPTQAQADPITAMGFLQVTDTSTGIGPMLVATDSAIYAYGTNQPRANWTGASGFGSGGQFGSLLVHGSGIVGQRGFDYVGSDMFFMSMDGHVRTLSMSRDEQKRWSRVPMSREVEPWLKYWDKSLARYAFVTYFNNKIFFSANPYRVGVQDFDTGRQISDYSNGGMVVLEFDNVVSMGQASNPTWAGLWTGVNPMDMVVSSDRCFIISKDSSRINRIYEVDPDLKYDTADGNIRPIRSRIYTREYNFKDPFQNKEIHSIDVNFDSLAGDFKFKAEYKPSHSHGFHFWRSFRHNVPWRACCVPCGLFINGYAHQFIREFTLGAPNDDTCDPVTKELYSLFRKLQFRLTIEGIYWELHEFRVKAIPRVRNETETLCEQFSPLAVANHCDDDWYVGDYVGCQRDQVT